MIFTLYVISISFCTKIEKISSSKIIAIFMIVFLPCFLDKKYFCNFCDFC